MRPILSAVFLAVALLQLAATTPSAPRGEDKLYRLDIFKAGLTAGKHSFRLVPDDSTQGEHEARLNREADGESSSRLGPLNQNLYFPIVTANVKDRSGILVLDALTVSFDHAPTVSNFVVPPFQFNVLESNSDRNVIEVGHWRVTANVTDVDIPVPGGDDGTLHVNDLPIQMTIMLRTKTMLVTSYIYEFEKLPDELLSGNMYDLNPGNASMLFKFLAKYDAEDDVLGIWASRRSPIPDFTLVVGRDGEYITHHSASGIPPGGLGLKDAFVDVKAHRDSVYTILAHFYEPYIEEPAVATLSNDDHDAIIKALRGDKGTGDFIEHAGFILHSSKPGTNFHLKYYNDTKHVAVQFTHSKPIHSVMLSVYDGNGKVLFRENERLIPYTTEPFGWYYVIPTLVKGEDEDEELQVSNVRIKLVRRIELHVVERPQLHPAELMSQWLKDNGANVDDVRVADNVQKAFAAQTHSAQELLRLRGLAANREFHKGDVVASIPYRTLLTSRVLETNEWCRTILRNGSAEYTALARENGFQPDGIHFMLLAFFAIAQPHHPYEGTNWRLYFDTWPKEHPPLPVFYSESELQYFAFSPSIDRDAKKMRKMWSGEYDILLKFIPWLKKVTPLERYLELRAHVETRVVNATGTLVMLPLMDFMNHADDATVRLTYSDQQQQMLFIAEDKIPVDAAITSNYGSKSLSKRDFLVQFGFVPPGAVDSSELQFGGKPYHLTMQTESSAALLQVIQDELAKGIVASDADTDAELAPKAKQKLAKLIQERLNALPTIVPRPKARPPHQGKQEGVSHLLTSAHLKEGGLELWASRLLTSERAVLQHHLTYLASTGNSN